MKFSIFNFQFSKNKRFGFTLLELLVAISIISILIAMGSASFSTAQKKGRDAKRKGDLRGISNAYEQYFTVCGNLYPATFTRDVYCASPSVGVLPTGQFPASDPKGNLYGCVGTCDTTQYSICSDFMEAEPTRYCVRSQQ